MSGGSEEAQLLNQIAQIAGAINRHKNAGSGAAPSTSRVSKPYRGDYRGGYRGGFRGGYRAGYGGARGGRGALVSSISRANQWKREDATDSTTAPTTTDTAGYQTIRTTAAPRIEKVPRHCPQFTKTGNIPLYSRRVSIRFNTGTCTNGLSCRFRHETGHVALCPQFLQGTCQSRTCTRSHVPTVHNSPLCSYYQKGHCTRENCKYSHIDVDPNAAVCRDFALVGYCDKGAECTLRHVFECPDFEATGKCPRRKCRLKHILRAKEDGKFKASPDSAPNQGIDMNAVINAIASDSDEDEQEQESEDESELGWNMSDQDEGSDDGQELDFIAV